MRVSLTRLTQTLGVISVCVLGTSAIAGCGGTSKDPAANSARACAAVPGMEAASAATAGPHFTNVPFPPGSVSKLTAVPEINGIQYRTVTACNGGKTPAAVKDFYSKEMIGHEWFDEPYLAPLDGDAHKACPSADVCYTYLGFDTPHYVVLEPPRSVGPATTWTLRLVTMPYDSGHKELDGRHNVAELDGGIPEGEVDDLSWDGASLSLLNSAQAANLGQRDSLNSFTYDDLSGASYSSATLSAGNLIAGTVIGIHTKDDRYAKMRVTSSGGGKLGFDYLTYPYKL